MQKVIEAQLVTSYVKLHAKIGKLQKQHEAKRQKLIKRFKDGYVCSTDSPYVLEYSEVPKTDLSWKEEWMKLAKDQLGTRWKKYLRKIRALAGETKVPTIHIKPNADYEEKAA